MNFAAVFLFALIVPSMMQEYKLESPQWRSIFKRARNVLFKSGEKTGGEKGIKKASRFHKIQTALDERIPFPCNMTRKRSLTPPESVHRLRPGDIDVIGAIGDSLTAANGAAATTLIEVMTENRGMSPIIGGQGNWRNILTVPNILKEFNPNLIGYSLSDGLGHHKTSQFNVAEPAATSNDIFFMAKELVRRMKNDKRVDIQKHWKLVTVFIGANDFCSTMCHLSPSKYKMSAEIHRRELMATLDYLRDNLPRTLVSVLLMPSLKALTELKGLPPYCNVFHLVACPCLFGLHRKSMLEEHLRMQEEWRRVQREVAEDKRYQQKSDFDVVLQLFAGDVKIPTKENGNADLSFLSADCFHLSQKGYALAANTVWNNMLEPVGKKSEDLVDMYIKFLCPTNKHPYIFTHGNSF